MDDEVEPTLVGASYIDMRLLEDPNNKIAVMLRFMSDGSVEWKALD